MAEFLKAVALGCVASLVAAISTLVLVGLGISWVLAFVLLEESLKSTARIFGKRSFILVSIGTFAIVEIFIKFLSIYLTFGKQGWFVDWQLVWLDLSSFPVLFLGGYILALCMHLTTALIYSEIRHPLFAYTSAVLFHYTYNRVIDLL